MAPNPKKSSEVKGDISQHKQDLELLKEQDPEFYAFLKHNDKALLEFGADLDDDEMDDDIVEGEQSDDEGIDENEDPMDQNSEQDEEDEPLEPMDEEMIDGAEESEDEAQAELLSLEMIKEWTDSMKTKHSIAATKKFISALSSVARANADDKAEDQQKKYSVESDEVYGQLILGAVQVVPLVFDHLFNIKDKASKNQLPIVSERWPKNRNIIKSWLTNLMNAMAQLTDIVMLDFVLRQLLSNNAVLYFACYGSNSLGRKFVKMILDVWSSVSSLSGVDEKEASSEEHQKRMKQLRSLKLSAFVIIRQLAFHAPSTFMDICLKSAYKAFLSVSSNTNLATLPHLKFLQDCLVELFKLDSVHAYQNAFVEIRQIATRLRNAITQMNEDTSKLLYTWQVVHGLKFWCHCLPKIISSNESEKNECLQLIYPLTQVCFGLLRHAQGSQFYPLQYHIIGGLNELSGGTETFIPVCASLMQILNRLYDLKKQKPASLKALDWNIHFRAPGNYLNTQIYTDDSIDKFLGLVVDNLKIWSGHVSFPELTLVCLMNLKKMAKESKNPRFVNFCKTIVAKISDNRQFIIDKRSTVTFAPNDVEAVRKFMHNNSIDTTPLGKYQKTLQVTQKSANGRT